MIRGSTCSAEALWPASRTGIRSAAVARTGFSMKPKKIGAFTCMHALRLMKFVGPSSLPKVSSAKDQLYASTSPTMQQPPRAWYWGRCVTAGARFARLTPFPRRSSGSAPMMYARGNPRETACLAGATGLRAAPSSPAMDEATSEPLSPTRFSSI